MNFVDFDDHIRMTNIHDFVIQEKIFQPFLCSSEAQAKFKISMFIRNTNMNKKNSNDLLNLIQELSSL